MNRTQEAAQKLQSLTDEILAETHALPATLVRWHANPEVWSIMDILCHIEEFIPYWTAQLLNVVDHSEEPWGRDHTHPDRLAAVQDTASKDIETVENAIRASVRESARTIRRLKEADLDVEAPSKNPRWGTKPAGFIVDHLLLVHLANHLGQIRRNIDQFTKVRRSSPQ
jgi:uncharacterized damage-inducible protein DinB